MSADDFQALTDWLALHPHWLAFALFLTAFLESLALAGIVIPGVAILFAMSAMAGQTAMPLMAALLWSGAGAVLGDGLSFALGRLFQGRLDRLWPLNRYPEVISKGEQFFRSHGGKSVIIGRFVGPVRPIIPLIAGALMMPWRRFLAFNLSSAVGWAPVYILPGYLVGSAMASEIKPPPHFYPVVAVSLLILTAVYLLFIRFQLGLGRNSRLYAWLSDKMASYQATHRFWQLYSSQRPDHAGEFPLPSLMLGFASLALFLIVSQLTLATDLLTPYDRLAADWLAQLRHPLPDGLMVGITLLGDLAVLLSAAVLAVMVMVFRGFYAAGIHLAAAALLTSLMVWLLKDATAIARPELVLQPPSSEAYPSGHATGVSVLCALMASFIAREIRPGRRWQYYLLFSVPIVMIAISRAYLGVHWMTDIIAGVLLGLAVTGFIRASFSRFDNRPITLDASLIAAAIVWGVFCVGYVVQQWPQAMAQYAPG
ncbi:bifunctional DedA family/phosphatase PAP2 family protein [Marinobacter confluentis]|uniref:Phosphatase PAP2 family protein n=1 Tax=Marinobacter confluentis TaxID=1697557 RepID=A0A4Z1C0B8_9GAMM|nr:bifunctional DedA family/phosphatase PAP2 family protein [Marinobacter confluentis]TGN38179.1 phosphatase PAP2 family protein [Marinobacter confluentis]